MDAGTYGLTPVEKSALVSGLPYPGNDFGNEEESYSGESIVWCTPNDHEESEFREPDEFTRARIRLEELIRSKRSELDELLEEIERLQRRMGRTPRE